MVASGFNPKSEKDQPSSSRSLAESSQVKRSRLLIIEDNRADVILVEEALAMHGINAEIEVITDGEEAMTYFDLNKSRPGLIILDLNLPKKDGHEILARVKSDTQYADVPVLIMTSSDSQEDRQNAARLGCDGYFLKPSSFDEFLKIGKVIKALIGTRGYSA